MYGAGQIQRLTLVKSENLGNNGTSNNTNYQSPSIKIRSSCRFFREHYIFLFFVTCASVLVYIESLGRQIVGFYSFIIFFASSPPTDSVNCNN